MRDQLNSSVSDASAEFESITAVVDEFAKKIEAEFSISGVSPDTRLTAFAARLQTLFDRSGRHCPHRHLRGGVWIGLERCL